MTPSAHERRRTIALVRVLQSLGPVKPKRVPRTLPAPQPPDHIALGYFHAISPVIERAREAFDFHARQEILLLLARDRRERGHHDAGGAAIGFGRAAQLGEAAAKKQEKKAAAEARDFGEELERASAAGKRAFALVDQAAASMSHKFYPRELHRIAATFGGQASTHAKRQLDVQLRAAMGVPLSALERPVREGLDEWAAANVSLIETVPDRYFDRLRGDVIDAFAAATRPEVLAETWRTSYGIAEDDARRIARDQIGRLAATVNQQRQQSLGITRYFWRDDGDNRVRHWHHALAQRSKRGETFAFDDPPVGGGTQEDDRGNPGDGIFCRCYPEPDLREILAG